MTALRRRDQPAITERPAPTIDDGESLRGALGIPAGLRINFGAIERGDVVDLGPLGALRRHVVRADWSPGEIERNTRQ